jgi:hypothetical protein
MQRFMFLCFEYLFLFSLMISPGRAEPQSLSQETGNMESSEHNKQFFAAECSKLLSAEDKTVLLLGRQISAIRYALEHPTLSENLKIITDLGTDQRYYMLVRGWLGYQLQGDMSILHASQGKAPEKIKQRVELLQQAIRRIDLE